jgi:class 3 adenylate cyclase
MERKLTAILCADVFGYSRLMGENEEATLRTLSSLRKLIDSLIAQHHGRFVNSAGDSVLAEFASVVNAVQCAVEIQTTLKSENANLPPERRMEFRIGINLGDVMVDGEQIYGDGVNVAARLESLADPGSIFISGSVHEQLGNKLAISYEDLGEQSVKNIAKPVRVFQVLLDGMPAARGETRQMPRKYWRWRAVVGRTRDNRRHHRDCAASLLASADYNRVDSPDTETRPAAPQYSFDRGAAVHQPERRPFAGIFQRWYRRPAYQRSLAVSGPIAYRTQFELRLQRQGSCRTRDR